LRIGCNLGARTRIIRRALDESRLAGRRRCRRCGRG